MITEKYVGIFRIIPYIKIDSYIDHVCREIEVKK